MAAELSSAESSSTGSAEVTGSDEGLLEIVVTAQRRSENLQQVPIAVSVLSSDFLKDHNVQTLQDLAALTPGLVTTNDGGYGLAPLAIRGIGGANGGGNVFNDEPVAVYVDGAYVSRVRFATSELLDTDSIQVLRGPQGTLFGRNSTAGALLITTAQPTEEFKGNVSATYASFDTTLLSAAISGPLDASHTLTARAALSYANVAGWGTNAFDDSRVNGQHQISGRVTLRYHPTEDQTYSLSGERLHSNNRIAAYATYNSSNLRSAANPGGSNLVYPYQRAPDYTSLINSNIFDQNVTSYTATTGNNVTLHTENHLGAVTLYSISNYRDWNSVGAYDSDGLAISPPLPPFVTGVNGGYGANHGGFLDSQWSEELRVASGDDRSRLTWTAGVMYYGEYNAMSPFVIYNYLAGPGGSGTAATFDAHQQTTSYSVFADAKFKISQAISLTIGGRETTDKKYFYNDFRLTTVNQFAPPPPAPLSPSGAVLRSAPSQESTSFKNFSPRAVLDYQIATGIFSYASVSRGYKAGGFNAYAVGPSTPFEPEKNTAYEIGVKSDLFDRRARVNLSVFDYEYRDLQIRQGVPSGGVSIVNVPKARSSGAELEGSWLPIPSVTLNANVAYADAHITKGQLGQVNGPSFVFGTAATSVVNVAGNQLSRAPHWQAYVSGDYKFNVPSFASIDALIAYRYQGAEYFLETQQRPGSPFYQGAWNQVDLRVSVMPIHTQLTVAAFVNNLNDERHISAVSTLFALPNAAVNPPRQYGVQISYPF
jgi:iron complex outermembrane receptor protein